MMWRTFLILFVSWQALGQVWVERFGGIGSSAAGSSVTVDGSGNIFLAGAFSGTVNFGGNNITSTNGGFVLAKYSNSGAHQWSFGFTGSISPTGIGLDSSGNIFVGGYYGGTANFGGPNFTSAGQQDCFLAKYSSSGQYIWSRSFGSTGGDFFLALAVDSQGNPAVTGQFQGTVDFGSGPLTSRFGTQENIILAKYNSANGSNIWAEVFLSNNQNIGRSIAVDSGNNIFITGEFAPAVDFGNGQITNVTFNVPNIYVAKFNTSGSNIWAKRYGGPKGDKGTAITVDGNGDAVVGGFFTTQTDLGGGTINGTGFYNDLFMAKYSGVNGAFVWGLGLFTTQGGWVNSVATDGQNNIVPTGYYFGGSLHIGSQVLNSVANSYDVWSSKLNSTGGVISAQSFGGTNTDIATAVVIDGASRPIITGSFSGTATFGNMTLTAAGTSDAFLMQLPSGVSGPTNWYVDSSKTGASNNSGTSPANAFTNWVPLGGLDGQWTGVAHGGDTIWVFPGVGYAGNRPGAPDGIVMFNITGLPNAPITFKAIQSSGLVKTPPFVVTGSFFTFDGRLSDTYTNLVNFDNLANLYQITNNINWWIRGFYGFGSNAQNGIYMPNAGYRAKFQWLHIDPYTYNTNNYPFGSNPNGIGSGTHGVNILQNTGEHLDGGEIAYCYIEEADQCCVNILNNNAPIWGGFRIHHNVLTKQGDAGARLAGGMEVDHNIIGHPWTIHGHNNGVVMIPSYSYFHHNIVFDTLDTMFYTPGGGSPMIAGIKVYNNLFYTDKTWSFIYTNEFSANLPFVNHSVGGLQFLVEANPNNIEPWLPQIWTNIYCANNTFICGYGAVPTNSNAGINSAVSLPNRFAPGNSLNFEPGLDRGFIYLTNMFAGNNLLYNVSPAGSGQTLGGFPGWVDRYSGNTNTWTNNAITSTAGILFDPQNVKGGNAGSTNLLLDYNVLTADQSASKAFGYNGPFSTNSTFASAEAFNTAYTTNGYIHNSSLIPSLVDTNYYDFHPKVSDTVLIGTGTNVTPWASANGGLPQVNLDLSGQTRSTTWSVGAYEPQTDLVLHLTFEDMFPATGSVAFATSPFTTDITGYGGTMGYYGFISTPTNWPTQVLATNTIGPGYKYAAQFVSNTNAIPAYGNFTIAQFGAITNISALSNLSAITVSCWAKYFPHGVGLDNVATIIDTCEGSPGNGVTWSLGRNSAYQTSFDLFTNLNYNTQLTLHLNFLDNESTDWLFYTATFNTTNKIMNIYLNGTNCGSRDFTGYSPALTNIIVGTPSTGGTFAGQNGWIAIGCRTHVGSPNLADSDLFPNNGWMDGQVEDLRVYNRALAAGEVLALYNSAVPSPGQGIVVLPQDPQITLNPLSQTITAPATATFTATATSTNSLTYQWFKNGSAIAGATATSFTTPATSTADNGSTWFMVATAGGRTAQSTTAVLTVGAPGPQDPIITLNPVGQSVTAPATATFTSTASSTQALTFQWSKNGSPIAGATQTTFTTPPTVIGDNGSTFFMVATAGGRTVQSSTVVLTVSQPGPQDPLITSSPLSQSVTAPASATFTASASSTNALTYQWYKNGVPIATATNNSYTTPPTSTADNGSTWFMIATAGGRTDQSATATLTVFPAGPQDPAITVNPLSQFVIAPAIATFTSSATSTQSIAFQWYKNGSPVAGATSTAYSTATAVTDNGSTWFMIATAGGRTAQSSSATLNVSPSTASVLAQVTNLQVGKATTGP